MPTGSNDSIITLGFDLAEETEENAAIVLAETGKAAGELAAAAESPSAFEREQAVLQEAGLSIQAFSGFGKLLSGTRRYTLVYVDDLSGAMEPDGVRLTFTLPSGSYATVLLRELMHSDPIEAEEAE